MPIYLSSISAKGLFGRFDITQEFLPGINIIFGKNGAGKTTLLHIIANALSGEFDRFKYLTFNSIKLVFSDERVLLISQKKRDSIITIEAKLNGKKIYPIQLKDNDELINISNLINDFEQNIINNENFSEEAKNIYINKYLLRRNQISHKNIEPFASIAYFPAFRTMIEAWASTRKYKEREESAAPQISVEDWKGQATKRARDWFGEFVPMINFPSLIEIEEQLAKEIETARMNIWRTDQELLSNAFLNVFASLSDTKSKSVKKSDVLVKIQSLFAELSSSPLKSESRISYDSLQEQLKKLEIGEGADDTSIRVLNVYKDVLEKSLAIQKKSFERLQRYQSSVNEFLDTKKISYRTDVPRYRRQSVGVIFEDNSHSDGLRTLSSGERQIVTLIYASTHMSMQDIVLIDEPEISLHVDWQRKLISKMAEQIGERQIIACTHAPVIGSDHLDKMRELSLSKTNKKSIIFENSDEEIQF